MNTAKRVFGGHVRRTVAACAILVATSSFAQAQWFAPVYRPPVIMDELTPREVINIVRAQGFMRPSSPVYRDDFVMVSATEPSGRRVRLMIDVYSGRIVERLQVQQARPAQPREQVVQRAPDQGPAIRRSVPDTTEPARATPDRPTTIRREPMLPPQPAVPTQPRARAITPEKPVAPPAQPPEASVGSGTKEAPRRIEMAPAVGLDAPPEKPRAPAGPPINSVPPAALE